VKSGRRTIAAGGGFSLHCPSGPISLLASGHVSAAVDAAMPLEHAVYESDWRDDLLEPSENVRDGRLWLPAGAGLGATLNRDLVNRFGKTWKP
ncbi:MAG: enolase C-terminal domain-like protein, partial [SAR202 cluster bacterium]|nr:enolase C-terminal domain-like protein [SAR202 cluster bacterium]